MNYKIKTFLYLSIISFLSCNKTPEETGINRLEVVTRHNVILNQADTLGSLSVGNGNFAYTVDITGMQTFPEDYENGISLGTMSNWGWHSIPSDSNYTRDDVATYYESCNEQKVPYAIQHQDGRAGRATHWLRANPHRLHLGIIGLVLLNKEGKEISLSEIENAKQELNVWTGVITSLFEVEGVPVKVVTVAHQENDQLSFKIVSPLIESKQLKIKIKFPYGAECHVCPGYDWNSPEKHQSLLLNQNEKGASIKRELDSTTYFVEMNWGEKGEIVQEGPHFFEIIPSSENTAFEGSISFSPLEKKEEQPDFNMTLQNSKDDWQEFWNSGGAIDLGKSTDARAHELERRIVLSQYLTKIQCSGSMPPQETGLTFNSWYGKFHMEMHWWHGVHFALWGRPQYLENSLDWYVDNLENARSTAEWQGYSGVRWQKMTTPEGLSSPSGVGEFLIWQQPHIIYFAELLYRNNPSEETLKKYEKLVFESAEFMASYAQLKEDGKYHLCPPLIPAQEHFKATETSDPAFELSYWHWGLNIAQNWKGRMGQEKNIKWQKVLDNLTPIPETDGLYLPTVEANDAWSNFEKRRDHPIVVASYGFLPNERIDTNKMLATFKEVMKDWDWSSTWGWDYPLLAMTATRLHEPELAIDALFIDTQKNTYLINGHNYQDDRLRLYLPGNGGLLTVVAMMAAGYEGNTIDSPGFPKNGKWVVKWEGLKPMF